MEINEETLENIKEVLEAFLESEKARETGETVLFQPPYFLVRSAEQAYNALNIKKRKYIISRGAFLVYNTVVEARSEDEAYEKAYVAQDSEWTLCPNYEDPNYQIESVED